MAADPHSAEFFAQALSYTPSGILGSFTGSAADKKAALGSNPSILKALVDSFTADQATAQWALATLYDLLRSDSSCFNFFEGNLSTLGVYKQTLGALRASKNVFISDKAAWILSGVIGNCSTDFSETEVQCFLDTLSSCSEQGRLDAAVNVLKASAFKKLVLSYPPSFIDMDFHAQSAAPAIVYKKMFVLWLVSSDGGALPYKADSTVQKIKEVLTYSRVEKVIRLTLTCLQSLLANKDVADEIVEQGLLEPVQALEFEKWRDAELYDEIRNMSSAISTRVAEMSNFARYERELSAGKLKWGFIHSPKFWSENVLKFEGNDWKALKALRACLDMPDPTTVAVSCHDLGEFVTAHPLGKKQVTALGVKDKVMQLMSSGSSDKEVKREALLCCQKIMLNKWQDVDTSA